MAYVPVPKDLANVKTKVVFGLTKRQLICFGLGALVGVPIFFLAKAIVGTSTAVTFMIVIMLPFFVFAMYERNGQTLETILQQIIRTKFIRPKKRPYMTDNFYSTIEQNTQTRKEVKKIVQRKNKTRH
jgi:hypothetical protein